MDTWYYKLKYASSLCKISGFDFNP